MIAEPAWRPVGLAVHERWSHEVACESGPVRAVVRVSALRATATFSMLRTGAAPAHARAAGFRLAAFVLEQVAAVDGWSETAATVTMERMGARVVVSGADAGDFAARFFGELVMTALRRRPRRYRPAQARLALGTAEIVQVRDGGQPVGDSPVITQRSRKAATPGQSTSDRPAHGRSDLDSAAGNVAEPQLGKSSLMERPHDTEHQPSRTDLFAVGAQ